MSLHRLFMKSTRTEWQQPHLMLLPATITYCATVWFKDLINAKNHQPHLIIAIYFVYNQLSVLIIGGVIRGSELTKTNNKPI